MVYQWMVFHIYVSGAGYMVISIDGGTPKSSRSFINHPFWGTSIHGNPMKSGWILGM